jgi:RNA polymerase sigma factor (sigma-70 family)
MTNGESGIVLRQIRMLWDEGRIGVLADEQLLEQFATRRGEAAEAAFEALVLRHGPTVLAVCRRVLRDPHQAEDAFQATFLILARKARSIQKREVLGGWLCKVAHRVAARSRASSIRRRVVEARSPMPTAAQPSELVEHDDVRIAILDEVHLLPEKYRLPVQLCYFEGRTHDEAARQLAWPVGTVRTRLAWARDRLRDRLTRRGLALSGGLIGTSLACANASAGVPAALVKATVEAATGRTVGAAVISLADGMLRAMLMSKIKLVVLFILATGSLAGVLLPFTWAQVGKSGPAGRSAVPQPGGPRDEAQEQHVAREVGTVFFHVVDQPTRQPLSGVLLKVWVDGKMTRQLTTDDSGRMVIPLPEKGFERLTVTARRDGLVPVRVYLRHFAVPETEIPRSYTLAMERGTSIGGIVRDEQGQPIEGVTVSLYDNGPKDRERGALDLDGISGRTDAQGRWHLDLFAASFDVGRLHFNYAHPEFLSLTTAVNNQPTEDPERLRKRSVVTVLRKGITITGRVLDVEGHAIIGASVQLGDRFWLPRVKTEAEGQFRIGNARAGKSFLTAQAPGHAPVMKPVDIRPGFSPVEFRLGAGRTIRGRVVDAQGQPVAGVVVGAYLWSGHQTLDWRADTDADGQYRWDNAPTDTVSVSASKRGYDFAEQSFEPSDKEHVVTLRGILRLRGTVTDAETGRPIETFTVVAGTEIGVNNTLWHTDFNRIHHGGRYEISFDALGIQPHRVRIEARGYLPALSPAHKNDAGNQVFDVRLMKGAWLEGLVRGPDGAPLAGAEVIVATAMGIDIAGGKAYQREFHPHLVTGPDGLFSFSPPSGRFRIIALHERGYAEASPQQLAEVRALTVEPWGRIEGTLRAGGKPLPHETLTAALDEERDEPAEVRIQNESRAETDEQGRFVIHRVAPGEARIHWQPENRGARTMPDRYYQPVFVDIRAGQAVHRDLMIEGGRPLLGRVVAPVEGGRPLDLAASKASLYPKAPEVPYPAGLAEGDRREWLHHWRFTDAARNFRHWKRGIGHGVNLQPDGSFRIDEVQPGTYELDVRITGYSKFTHDLTVPEAAAGQGAIPMDLGVLTLKR